MEQETLEEAAERIYPVVIKPILDVYDDGVSNQIGEEDINEDSRESFIAGAKSNAARDYWYSQFQEQDKNKYSEEEVCEFVEWLNLHYRALEHTISFKDARGTKELLQQLKKQNNEQ